jgi:hypothetical protein
MNHYGAGTILVLAVPENIGDLYSLPQGVLTAIKSYVQQDFPVRIDAPPKVSLFAYDNGTFVVESFRADETHLGVSVAGTNRLLRDLATGEVVAQSAAEADSGPVGHRQAELERNKGGAARTLFTVALPPHSYRAFKVEH